MNDAHRSDESQSCTSTRNGSAGSLYGEGPRMTEEQPHLYTDLARWFHLLTAPADYAPAAAQALAALTEAIGEPPVTILELGSGGGNNASHMKAQAHVTLTDLSGDMLELSRTINPECEHIQGDMRSL